MPDDTNQTGSGLVTLYTTEPCGHCRNAKQLLTERDVSYVEVNLAKDPAGRSELLAKTGMMTFPQLVVDDSLVGGFREMLELDREGRLDGLAASEAGLTD